MFSRLTTFLILTAITLQGVFGSLRENVIICLGGGHEHEPAEVIEHCDLECTHHSEWPTPTTGDDHLDDCECTDIELGLIALLSTPRATDLVLQAAPPPPVVIEMAWQAPAYAPLRGPPPNLKDDPGGKHRLAIVRSTRLLL